MSSLRILIVFCLVLFATRPGHAEWMADAYLGLGNTNAVDNEFVLGGSSVRPLAHSDWATPIGFRLGYWFEGYPWLGIAADISAFFPVFGDKKPSSFRDITITQLPITGLLLLRYPFLKSDAFPKGRMQPYVAAGPSIVFSALSEFAGPSVPPPAVLEDTSWTLGFDARAGLTWLFNQNFGTFVEYRYLRSTPDLESRTGGGTVSYNPTFHTNSVVGGITFRF